MDALGIAAEQPQRHARGIVLLDLVQEVQVQLHGVERTAGARAVGSIEADAVHERIGGEADDQSVVGIPQMAVVVDPLRIDRRLVEGDARHVQCSRSRSRACAGLSTRAPMASMMVRAFSTSCALLAYTPLER